MKKIALFFVLLLLSIACSTPKKEIKRPHEPWVFRSVLDGKPRMLTATLHEKLWIAYSTEKCRTWKAWKGDVNFDGAVYTGAHGPQPISRGNAYFTDSADTSPFQLWIDNQAIKTSIQYKGHSFRNNQVILKYALKYEKDKEIILEEIPEYAESAKKEPGLKRTFRISNAPKNGKIVWYTKLDAMIGEKEIFTNTTFEIKQKKNKDLNAVHVTEMEVAVTLKNNEETNFTAYFIENAVTPDPATLAKVDGASMESMFENKGCYSCHNPEKKTVGPAYIEIANKYKKNAKNIDYLATKVIQGGKGNWGEALMNPHPDLPKEDAVKMVEYILAMNPENNKTESEASKNTGMTYHIYQLWEDWNTLKEIPKDAKPYKSFNHRGGWIEIKDVLPVQSRFLINAKATLNMPKAGNALFKIFALNGGAVLRVNNKVIIDEATIREQKFEKQGEITLEPGQYEVELNYYTQQLPEYTNISSSFMDLSIYNSEGKYFAAWFPEGLITFDPNAISQSVEKPVATYNGPKIPGDGLPLESVHPAFELTQARPDTFKPRVAGLDFFEDGRMVISTWDSLGAVYVLDNLNQKDHNQITYKKIAFGLAEPLGIKVVGKDIYVLQKQELTRLVDTNGDEVIDEYQTLCNGWTVGPNFHEFAFGLAYKDEHFYFNLAIGIEPGGKSSNPQKPDRGKVVKVHKNSGKYEFVAHGLRTPNGIGIGVENEIFVADNQGDWLPASKIAHVKKDAFFGSRAVDFKGTENLQESLPVVWLPQDEIGNSPSQPLYLNFGPYKGQMMHGEITHGGIKRVFVEKINGQYQGVVFRFIQGLEAGVNRLAYSPDGQLYVGQIGVSGNWGHTTTKGMGKYGLQRLKYNQNPVFEMLAVRAKTNGMEIEFTEPLQIGDGWNPDDYLLKQWRYQPTEEYGGPKLDEEILLVKSVNISSDRKKVFLELENLKENRVVYIRLRNHFISTQNRELWSTEAWYTLNQIPQNNLGKVNPEKYTPIPNNELTAEESKNGWKLLFDGKTTKGWHNFNQNTIGSAWKVADGTLMLDNSQKDKNGQIVGGGDIVTEENYENFELRLEWKISEAGNSGLFFNVVEDKKYDYIWKTGPEMQVLDNAKHPDARYPTHHAGDLYDLIACKFVTVKPAGEWNQVRLVVRNGKVEHWLNGHKVVEYQMFDENWRKMIANSKFKEFPDFGKAKKGKIALQDHSDKVWFRNIKIRKL